jgi:large subunit ribosomal protein L25
MAKITLNVGIRERVGKGASRLNRKNKLVPGIIYGEKAAPTPIEIPAKEWEILIQKPGLKTKAFEIITPKGKEDAMLIAIQYHPVSDAPIHVDFKRIDIKKPVNVTVPVYVINEEISRGVKAGGAVNFAVRSVELVAKIDEVPESITVDLADMSIGAVVHGSDLPLPKGVALGLHQADLAFVAITGKEDEKEDATPAAAASTAAPAAAAAKAAPAKK